MRHPFRKPFVISIAMHVVLLTILMIELPARTYRMPGPVNHEKIVQAVAVDQQQVQAQIKAIKLRERQKRDAELAHLKKLRTQEAAARRIRLREQRRVAQLKAQQLRIKQQQIAQQKALAAQRKKRLAQKRLQQKRAKQQRLQRLAKQQQQLQQKLLQQQMLSEQHQLQSAKAQQMAGEIDQYKAQILQAIGQQWVIPSGVSKQLSSKFLIHVAPGGVVLTVKLLQSSGNSALDRSAQVAILKASPLPVPKNPAVFDKFRELRLTVSPKQIING